MFREDAMDWLQNPTIGFPDQASVDKIDTHHHFVPKFYAKAVEGNGGDPSGWPTPRWSQHASEVIMNRMGIQTAILSITAPGACILSDGQAQAALARQLNEYAATLCHRNPSRFRFFASLPDIRDLSAAISEIQYAMDSLHADGVILFTRYGPANTYLGHPEIEPVWQELNKRKAVVFIHPTHPVDTNKVNPKMSQPMIDYPHETTRTAVDMITSQTLQKFPDVKVILSHAGGSLPYLISRVATPLKTAPEFAAQWKTGTTHRDVMRSFRSFYYDTALSSSTEVLNMLLRTVPHDHILFGSDFPYAPAPAYPAFLEELESFEMDPELRSQIYFKNARRLFPELTPTGPSL